METGICPLYRAEENVIRIILECSGSQRWKKSFLLRKSFILNRDTSVKKTVRYIKIKELRKLGTILCKSKGK
jgi:hypothetical protein